MKTLPTYDPKLFEGAAPYYAQYRTKYPASLFVKLAELFNINGQGRLLDLGCGPGLIAIPLQKQFEDKSIRIVQGGNHSLSPRCLEALTLWRIGIWLWRERINLRC